ncbi:MAG: PHP domain-containing protein [Methanophagales archaeon]|nr:PHP domain-containing protein [Methanophagales archaeon]
MKYDLHIHSKYSSDGIIEPEKIIKIALKRGLDGIAITDHSTIKR